MIFDGDVESYEVANIAISMLGVGTSQYADDNAVQA